MTIDIPLLSALADTRGVLMALVGPWAEQTSAAEASFIESYDQAEALAAAAETPDQIAAADQLLALLGGVADDITNNHKMLEGLRAALALLDKHHPLPMANTVALPGGQPWTYA